MVVLGVVKVIQQRDNVTMVQLLHERQFTIAITFVLQHVLDGHLFTFYKSSTNMAKRTLVKHLFQGDAQLDWIAVFIMAMIVLIDSEFPFGHFTTTHISSVHGYGSTLFLGWMVMCYNKVVIPNPKQSSIGYGYD